MEAYLVILGDPLLVLTDLFARRVLENVTLFDLETFLGIVPIVRQALLLLSTTSTDLLPQLVGGETTTVIWSAISRLYSQLSTTRVMHLDCRLHSIKKVDLTMRAYTMQIKEICDLLVSCGSPMSPADKEPYTVEGVVSVLIDAETRLAHPLRLPIGINIVSFSDTTPLSEYSQCVNMRP
ncbi:hypothetical protein GQ457_01G015700 [Hibiscus cannabinus]